MTIRNLHLLPLSTFVLLPLTSVVSYVMAVSLGHVVPSFPYISDSATLTPESNVFGQLLNICCVLVLASMYVRYKQVEQFYRDNLSSESVNIQKWNAASLWVGVTSTFGMSMVANFQETAVLEAHLVGATILFAFGNVYIWLQTIMSYRMHPLLNTLAVARIRLLLAVLATIGFIFTAIFAAISLRKFQGSNKRKWKPKDGGYTEHVVSSVSEWVMSLAFDFYFLTYVREFHLIVLESPKVHFVMAEGDLPTSDIYSSSDQVEITQSQQFQENSQPSINNQQVTSAVIH